MLSLKRNSGSGQPGNPPKRTNATDSMKLNDLPIELLERILIKVVTMEVKSMKLVKSVWQVKANQLVGRLRTVCAKWNSIVTTDSFRNELHRALEQTDDENVRLEIISLFPIELGVLSVVALGRDLYVLRRDFCTDLIIEVYDPSVIPLSKDILYLNGMHIERMAACANTGSVYLVCKHDSGRSILRVTKMGPQQYQTTKWIERIYTHAIEISVSSDGCLVLLSTDTRRGFKLSTYDPYGLLMNKINFDINQTDIVHIKSVVRKPNGRFIFIAANGRGETRLREMSEYGETVRVFESLLDKDTRASLADRHGRIILDAGSGSDLILLDQEFNIVPFSGPLSPGVRCSAIQGIQVTSDLSEMTSLVRDGDTWTKYRLVVFRFTED